MLRCIFNKVRNLKRKEMIGTANHRLCHGRVTKTHERLTLYGDEISPPVRFVMMTASLCNVELDFYKVDLFKSEHKAEFYEKINPLQKVPALRSENEVIIDSHAIALYLCSISDNPELLCPSDPLQKARVIQMLFFNSSILFPIDSAIFTEYFQCKWPAQKEMVDRWYSALDFLEKQLCVGWLAGDKMSLCDLCCSATVTSLMILLPLLEKHTNIKKWLENLQQMPCFDINRRGLEQLIFYVDYEINLNK